MCCMAQVTRAIDRTHTWGTSGALGFTHNGCARLVHSWRPLQTCLWVTRLVQRHRAGNVAMRRVRSCIVLKHTRTYLCPSCTLGTPRKPSRGQDTLCAQVSQKNRVPKLYHSQYTSHASSRGCSRKTVVGFTSHALTARGSAQKRPKEAKRGLGDIWKIPKTLATPLWAIAKYLGFDWDLAENLSCQIGLTGTH